MAQLRHTILVLNGPNLNVLPARPGDAPGGGALLALARDCEDHGAEIGLSVDFRQTNHEGEMITLLHESLERADGVIVNAAGYAFTSIALQDALKIIGIPVIEVNLDNPARRDALRQKSLVAAIADGVISGFGPHGYILALDAMSALLDEKE